MKSLVISDREIPDHLFQSSVIVNLNNIQINHCLNTQECQYNHSCIYQDDMKYISKWLQDSTLLIFITKIKYGMPDSPLLKVLDRLIIDEEPYYTKIDEKTVHLSLSQNKKRFLFIGYSDNQEEKELFQDYLQAFRLSYNYSSLDTYTCKNDEIDQVLHTFGGVDG